MTSAYLPELRRRGLLPLPQLVHNWHTDQPYPDNHRTAGGLQLRRLSISYAGDIPWVWDLLVDETWKDATDAQLMSILMVMMVPPTRSERDWDWEYALAVLPTLTNRIRMEAETPCDSADTDFGPIWQQISKSA